jgi:Fe-S oxidoreductase
VNCPANATGKRLNPKYLILRGEDALLSGALDTKLVDVFEPNVLWQCTTCGACENQCPVGVEHLPLVIGARRGLVSNGDAPDALGAVFNNLERRGNIWGLGADQRQKFVQSAGLETFDALTHEYLVWLGCAGAFEADFQKALRSLFAILRAQGVTFGVLAKERCTGDIAKRTGNEYQFQELATANIQELTAAGVTKIVTGCPHCLRTIGVDYQAFGFHVEIVHATALVAELTKDVSLPVTDTVTFHDPCYLGRYAGLTEEPRNLLRRFGAGIAEPARHGDNPFCCGAGGGLLFEEHEEGTRISRERLEQLRGTGARTIVTACPFCAIMLKGAVTSGDPDTTVVDVMTFVEGRLARGRA